MAGSRQEKAINKARFSQVKMVLIVRQAYVGTVAETTKKHGILEQTIYRWRKRFGQFEALDVRPLRQIEAAKKARRRACSRTLGDEGN